MLGKILFLYFISFFLICGFNTQAQDLPEGLIPQSLLEDFGGGAAITAGRQPTPVVPIALDMIKHFEGWRPDAHNDPVGYCTIGYGHLIALQRCEESNLGKFSKNLTIEEGIDLLERDTRSARLAVDELVKIELSDNQFSALAVFVFNIGKGNFEKSTLLSLINEEEFQYVSREFGRWVNAKGTKLPGLVIRRACEAALFDGALQYDASGQFSRDGCKTLGIAPSAGAPIDVLTGE